MIYTTDNGRRGRPWPKIMLCLLSSSVQPGMATSHRLPVSRQPTSIHPARIAVVERGRISTAHARSLIKKNDLRFVHVHVAVLAAETGSVEHV